MAKTNPTVSLKKLSLNDRVERMSQDNPIVNLTDEEDLLKSDDDDATTRAVASTHEERHAQLVSMLLEVKTEQRAFTLFSSQATEHIGKINTKLTENDKRMDAIEFNMKQVDTTVNDRLDWFEQEKLRNNVSIVGIPPSKNEKLNRIVVDICKLFGMKIEVNAIEDTYRTKLRNSNMVIAKFTSYDTKSQLMDLKLKQKKVVTVGDIASIQSGSAARGNVLYINSQVTPTVGRMQHVARIGVNNRRIAKHWLSSRGLMVKKPDEEIPICVTNIEQLKEMIGYDDEMMSKSGVTVAQKRPNAKDSPSPQADRRVAKIQRGHNGKGNLIGPKSKTKQRNTLEEEENEREIVAK